MSLSNSEKKQYRSIGHQLHAIVTIAGNGLSENVLAELERALEDHELIKVKLNVPREEKPALTDKLLEASGAELVQAIGHILLIFRQAKTPNPKLSNLPR